MKISAGLVILHDNKILLVHPTNSRWYGTYSIPKGKVEEGEDILDAAIRETKEEIGIEFNKSQIDLSEKGYITYKSVDGRSYKKIYFFVVKLKNSIYINKNKLQREEVNWAGFLTKEEAEKRIFHKQKSLLQYLK